MAHSGRRKGYGRQRRLHRSGARLGREEQGREAVLGDDDDVPQRASQHGRAERLLRRRVLLSLSSIFGLKIAKNVANFVNSC